MKEKKNMKLIIMFFVMAVIGLGIADAKWMENNQSVISAGLIIADGSDSDSDSDHPPTPTVPQPPPDNDSDGVPDRPNDYDEKKT